MLGQSHFDTTLLLIFSIVLAAAPCKASDPHAYFKDSYAENRQDFLERARKLEGAKLSSIRVPSRTDPDLTIDVLYLEPSGEKKALFMLSSGTHGVEGYAGSAVQNLFLDQVLPHLERKHLGLLFVHAINPWGYKYDRRVSENNVDLNRNFPEDPKTFESQNEGYAKFEDFLNPKEKASHGFFPKLVFFGSAIVKVVQNSIKTMRQATTGGQYAFEKGIFYGGRDYEPQKRPLESLVRERARGYANLLFADLHTGYGARGELHLISNAGSKSELGERTARLFDSHLDLQFGGEGDFYKVTGEWVDYACTLVKGSCTPIVVEFGTNNSHTTLGGISALLTMTRENQGVHLGYESEAAEKKVKNDFLRAFYPESKEWRESVIKNFEKHFPRVLTRLLGQS